jgi:signal transduction histidine kinase
MVEIFTLIPERIQYEQFWIDIKSRNKWLIKLRYMAVIMLISLIAIFYILDFFFPRFEINILPIWVISFSILGYNLVFHKLWNKLPANHEEGQRFHSLHFSLIQIITDFISLMLLIYFTGGIESPLYSFFLFHVIIGSLLMPSAVINFMISITILITLAGAIMELNNIIPHYTVHGIISFSIYDNIPYLIVFFTFFSITLFLSNYLANSIAKRLYQREKDLTKAYQELDNAEKVKSKYVMTIVHDLKTPIAAAITYLNMILDGMMGEINSEQLRPLERSKSRLDAAITTINDILHISQLKISTDPTDVEKINLKELFEEFYSDMLILFNAKKIDFQLEMIGEDVSVEAEPKIFKYALANLVSNAHKYTELNGKVVIKLIDENDKVSISVADNGIGIPDKEKEKIFKDFYRSSLSKQKGIEGTGLGMSVVVNTIQKYHGSIILNSPSYLAEDGKPGTEFIIILPKRYSII